MANTDVCIWFNKWIKMLITSSIQHTIYMYCVPYISMCRPTFKMNSWYNIFFYITFFFLWSQKKRYIESLLYIVLNWGKTNTIIQQHFLHLYSFFVRLQEITYILWFQRLFSSWRTQPILKWAHFGFHDVSTVLVSYFSFLTFASKTDCVEIEDREFLRIFPY